MAIIRSNWCFGGRVPITCTSFAAMGNEKANSYWEAELPRNYDRVGIEHFIRAKYVVGVGISSDLFCFAISLTFYVWLMQEVSCFWCNFLHLSCKVMGLFFTRIYRYEEKRWVARDRTPPSPSTVLPEVVNAPSSSENDERKNAQVSRTKPSSTTSKFSIPLPPKGAVQVCSVLARSLLATWFSLLTFMGYERDLVGCVDSNSYRGYACIYFWRLRSSIRDLFDSFIKGKNVQPLIDQLWFVSPLKKNSVSHCSIAETHNLKLLNCQPFDEL